MFTIIKIPIKVNIFTYICRMSKKGSITTADYIPFEKASAVGDKLMKHEKSKRIGLYVLVAINTGLRISDLLPLRLKDVLGDKCTLVEKKTGKNRQVKINENIKKALNMFQLDENEYLFLSQKGCAYTTQSMNRILKNVFKKEAKSLNISSHSLRKSFGRKVFENNGESEKALTYLSELFNHSSQSVTRKYLGIRQEELNDIYDGLV